jgi:predicted nucleic acid-binding protein
MSDPRLAELLGEGQVLMHAMVRGQLACRNLRRREELLANLNALPQVRLASDAETAYLLEQKRLWGRGLGWVDVHLLASAILARCTFWTLDRELQTAARQLGIPVL